jgi:hypothetical protein
MTEAIRFITVRPPKRVRSKRAPSVAFMVNERPGSLAEKVRRHRSPAERGKLLALIEGFRQSEDFIESEHQLDRRFIDYHAALTELTPSELGSSAQAEFKSVFDTDPASLVDEPEFRETCDRLSDSIVAAAIDPSVTPQSKSVLSAAAAACAITQGLADGREIAPSDVLSPLILFPRDLLPLPSADVSLTDDRRAEASRRLRRTEDNNARLKYVSEKISAYRRAVDELVTVTALGTPDGAPEMRAGGNESRGAATRVLERPHVTSLSSETRSVLRAVGVGDGADVSRSVAAIERQLANLAARLHSNSVSARMVRIGDNLIPRAQVPGTEVHIFEGMADAADEPIRLPSLCPMAEPAPPPNEDAPAVPLGRGKARVLGMAELMRVEQELDRYELGEIAHIENVLKSETRDRRFRTSTTTEESLLIEKEHKEESERDLASAERFELQRASQNVINDSASLDAGLTINASYGPSVDATATTNYASTSSTQQSDSASSSFARETTSRAVSRIQERTLERRFTRTVRTIEESNRHSFDNSKGTENISGVYRYVDKIYTAQVVNYGKRLMLEFIVPEPAAFWRYAIANQPLENVPYVRPNPPGYCLDDGHTFVDLQAHDLRAENYLHWASRYGAEDVQPPPATMITVSATKKSPDSMQKIDQDGPKIGSEAFDVDIPDGYLPYSAFVNAYGETELDTDPGTETGDHKLMIQIQEQQFQYTEPWQDQLRFYLRLEPTKKVPVSVNAVRFHNFEVLVTVACLVSQAAYEKWQLETYFAIMNAYEAAKARYENAVAAEKIRDSYQPSFGRNSIENRQIEQTELKRAAISLMTGQRFDLFNAMTLNVPPHGFPELDFDQAEAEGRYIQFFEQAFEWNNMTYLFYPYFWNRKDQWPTLVQISDSDILFKRFLLAGAARVQVPVRPGFNTAVRNYLAGFGIWNVEANLVSGDGDQPDALQLSLVDELRSQLGDSSVPGSGTLAVTHDDTVVTGTGTKFDKDNDMKRRINIGGEIYVIQNVHSSDRVMLSTPYAGQNASGLTYSLGPRLVGEPWEVKLPTNLVKLDEFEIH